MQLIQLYTDGACAGNPGRGGWSAIAFNEEGDNIMQTGDGYRHTTNNRMEILAVAEGLNCLARQIGSARDTDIKVTVCSDSQLVVNTMNKGWSPAKNLDLWKRLNEAVALCESIGMTVEFLKVKGHSTDERNNLADEVAVSFSAPENATKTDSVYEGISSYSEESGIFDNTAPNNNLDDEDEFAPVNEPEVLEIRLKNANVKELRELEIDLSNGTTVKVHGLLFGGFEQYNCTTAESAITLDIAERFCGWLNGREL